LIGQWSISLRSRLLIPEFQNLRLFIFFSLLSVTTTTTTLFGQDAVLSTNPTSVKWYQVKTPGFKILYSKGFEEQGQRMAKTLEAIREPASKGMSKLPKRIPIVLQNLSAQSNAFVTLAPRRSEFYAMPSQNYNFVGNLDWLDLLAVHEYRHIAQFQRSITGFNKLLYYTFGQEAVAGMAFASAPSWFWEGDAVATETAFTQSGRGRMPNFDLVFRMNLLEGRTFNYNKQYLRSYKHFIPNHYVLGYNMVSYLRKQTGKADSWGNIAGRTWSLPFIPFAFSRSMKKEVGSHMAQFYRKMASGLKTEYEKQLSEIELTTFDNITVRENKAYTDFMFPQVMESGSIAAIKSGIGDIDQVVILNGGEGIAEKFVTGPMNETGFLSAAQNRVVWNEYRYDPRWPIKDYSIIKGFDFNTRSRKDVVHRSRFAGAALSPDGEKILTVETNSSYQTKLVVLNYATGEVEKEFTNRDDAFYSMARFSDDGKKIVSLKTVSKGKSVVMIDYDSGKEEELISASNENIGHPVVALDYLFYNSPLTGIDNIYAMDLKTKKRFQVTSAKYGAYNPCLSKDGRTLYYNNQGRDGMDVVKMECNPARWKAIEEVRISTFNTYSHLVEQEGDGHILENASIKRADTFPTSRYRKLPHMFNIHSWGTYVTNDLTRVNIGLTSKDILSTTQIKAGYEFDVQERSGMWKTSVSAQALYPILDFSYSLGRRSVDLDSITYRKIIGSGSTRDTVERTEKLDFDWIEQTVEGGIRLPFNLTRSKYLTHLTFSNYVGVTKVSDFKNSIDNKGRLIPDNLWQYFFETYLDNGTLLYNSFDLTFSNLLRRSTRDINSKWGQAIFTKMLNTPYGGDFNGKNFSFLAYGFFPGVFKHHSLWGYWGYQSTLIRGGRVPPEQLPPGYIFRNQVPTPRGLSEFIGRSERIYTMSGNYTMPLWYPDISIGPLLNFKRVRANGFVDYAFVTNPKFHQVRPDADASNGYLSVGGELKFDINIMRFLPEFDIGFRYSYGIQPRTTVFEVLVGTFNF
jgi:hypothetical protein